MAKYKVARVYASSRDGIHYGPYTPGEEVELDQETAEWMNRDSPELLTPVEREMPPTPNRQVRKSPKTR
jgi:hypothetical protein